jgi:phosphosulfolactate synthase
MGKKARNWDMLEDKAFSFVKVPPRSKKPRENGITVMLDRSMGIRQVKDLLEVRGDYLDWAKLGGGYFRLHTREFLREKIDLYNKHDVDVFFAGDLIEFAIIQGVVDQFFNEVKELGAQGVEVSTSNINLSLEDTASIVKLANEYDLKVITEIGKKGEQNIAKINENEDFTPMEWYLYPKYMIKQIRTFLKAGTWKIILEGEGISEDVKKIKGDVYYQIATDCDTNDIIFEAKSKKIISWMIKAFGNEINLSIWEPDLIFTEMYRRGFLYARGQTFGLVGS